MLVFLEQIVRRIELCVVVVEAVVKVAHDACEEKGPKDISNDLESTWTVQNCMLAIILTDNPGCCIYLIRLCVRVSRESE